MPGQLMRAETLVVEDLVAGNVAVLDLPLEDVAAFVVDFLPFAHPVLGRALCLGCMMYGTGGVAGN